MSLNYLKDKHVDFLLELIQKYEKIFDWILGKCTGPNYTIELKKMQSLFLFQKFMNQLSRKKMINKLK